MALRNISDAIKAALANNDPLLVYHLVKFEKPSQLAMEAEKETDYVYLTDAPYPVQYPTPLGPTYLPGGLLKVGKVPESTEAKATNMNLTLSATKLGKKSIAVGVYLGADVAAGSAGIFHVQIDLFKSGFYPGDDVTFTKRSDGSKFKVRIDRLAESSLHTQAVHFTNLESVTISDFSLTSFDIEYDSAEVNALIAGGVTEDSNGNTVFSPVSFDNYINRHVTIYRVFANPSTGAHIGDPVLLFKGIIAKVTTRTK